MKRVAAVICLLGLAPLTPSRSWAATRENIYLREGRSLYEQMEYEKSIPWLRQALSVPGNESPDLAQIEVFIGLCHYALGDIEEANTHFRVAVSHDAAIKLPPDVSPRIAADFEKVRAQHKKDAVAVTPLPSDVPEAPAPSPKPPVPSTHPSPLAQSLKAQPHRSLVLPVTFASVSAVSAGAGLVLGLSARSSEKSANSPGITREQYDQFSDSARSKAKLANIAFGIAAATAVTAVVTYLFHL